MAMTNAESVARSKLHTRGDHSRCDPLRCTDRAAGRMLTIPPGTALYSLDPEPWKEVGPTGLGPRGEALKEELSALPALLPGDGQLIEEAARIADRLDILARIIAGDDHPWLVLQVDLRKNILGEARQHALALKTLVEKLQGKPLAKPATGEPESSTLDDLTRRRTERLARAANS